MREMLNYGPEQNTSLINTEATEHIGKVSVFEALAIETTSVGINRSNQTSIQGPNSPDFDDQ